MKRGDPEKLRRSEADIDMTQPVDRESVRRARILGDLNEQFADALSGKSIRYGGNEYEFLQVMREDGDGGALKPDDFVMILREKGTEIVTKVDSKTFREQFEVS